MENQTNQVVENTTNPTQSPINVDYDKLADVLDKRQQGIAKSYLKEQGLSDDEVKTAIEQFKNSRLDQDKQKTKEFEETAKKLNELQTKYQQERLNNEAFKQALELGIDKQKIAYVSKLADFKKAINDKGEINAEEIKKALEQVITDVPEFKKTEQSGKQGITIGANSEDSGNSNSSMFGFNFNGVRGKK